MSSLVQRLRDQEQSNDLPCDGLCDAAADEIEQLREPTVEMLNAGYEADDDTELWPLKRIEKIYRAMVAAASESRDIPAIGETWVSKSDPSRFVTIKWANSSGYVCFDAPWYKRSNPVESVETFVKRFEKSSEKGNSDG